MIAFLKRWPLSLLTLAFVLITLIGAYVTAEVTIAGGLILSVLGFAGFIAVQMKAWS